MKLITPLLLFSAAVCVATLLSGLLKLVVLAILFLALIAQVSPSRDYRLLWLLFLQRFASKRLWAQHLIRIAREDGGGGGAMPDAYAFNFFFTRPFVYVFSPELIRQVLVTDVENFPKSQSGALHGAKYLFSGDNNILLRPAPSDPAWRMHREVTAPLNADRFGNGSLVGKLFEAAWRNAERCGETLGKRWHTPSKPVDLFLEVFKYAVEVHMCAMFGEEFNAARFPELADDLLGLLDMTAADAVFPRLFGATQPNFFELKRTRRVFEHVVEMCDNATSPMFKMFRASAAAHNMPVEDMHGTSGVLAYGLAPAYVVFWAVYALSLHPIVERKLLDEIDATLSQGPLTYERVNAMPYLTKVVAETLRMYPGVPMLFSRTARQAVALGSTFVPAGSTIIIAPCVSQRNGRYFKEPDVYNPDREGLDVSNSGSDLLHIPFGVGPRICQGQFYAESLVKACLVSFASRFRAQIVPGQDPVLPEPAIYNRPHRQALFTVQPRVRETKKWRPVHVPSWQSIEVPPGLLADSGDQPQRVLNPLATPRQSTPPTPSMRGKTRLSRNLDGMASFMSPRMEQQTKQLKALVEHENLTTALKSKHMLVLYASQGGKSRSFARRLSRLGRRTGIDVACCSTADFSFDSFSSVHLLVVVCSTYGNGDPPDEGRLFRDWLDVQRRAMDFLGHMQYAVLAFGSSVFPSCFAFGRFVDRRIHELGGSRLLPVTTIDEIKYRDQPEFSIWSLRLFRKIGHSDAQVAATVRARGIMGLYDANNEQAHGSLTIQFIGWDHTDTRTLPPDGTVELVVVRTDEATRDREHAINHIELQPPNGQHFAFETGDDLIVYPSNSPSRVQALLDRLQLPADALFKVTASEDVPMLHCEAGNNMCTLRVALTHFYEIGTVPPDLLRFLSTMTTKWSEQALLERSGGEDHAKFAMDNLDLLDVLNSYPGVDMSGQGEQCIAKLLSLLTPLKPRKYSVSSSSRNARGLIRLTYKLVKYKNAANTERLGVCSSYLASRRVGDRVAVRVQPNDAFRLPSEPDLPIVLCCAGSGVSPFLAFVEQRMLMAPHHETPPPMSSRTETPPTRHRRDSQRQKPFLPSSSSADAAVVNDMLYAAQRDDAARTIQRFYRRRSRRLKVRQRMAQVPRPESPKRSKMPKLGAGLLFYGCAQPDSVVNGVDYWRRAVDVGALTAFLPAYSAHHGQPSVHIQDKLVEHGSQVWELLQRGATVYSCGDVKVGIAVTEALVKLAMDRMQCKRSQAIEYVKTLERTGHLRRSEYGLVDAPNEAIASARSRNNLMQVLSKAQQAHRASTAAERSSTDLPPIGPPPGVRTGRRVSIISPDPSDEDAARLAALVAVDPHLPSKFLAHELEEQTDDEDDEESDQTRSLIDSTQSPRSRARNVLRALSRDTSAVMSSASVEKIMQSLI